MLPQERMDKSGPELSCFAGADGAAVRLELKVPLFVSMTVPIGRAPWPKLALGGVAALSAITLFPGKAKSILTYNIFQSGPDVIIQPKGSLNLSSPSGSDEGFSRWVLDRHRPLPSG
jgi:hypothetical protein